MSSPEDQLGRSVGLFMDPANYGEFDRLDDGSIVVTCADPRDEADTPWLRTSGQTAGGAIGVGIDAYHAESVITSDTDITVRGSLFMARNVLSDLHLAAHEGCRFVGSIGLVSEAMAAPDREVFRTVQRWAEVNDVTESITIGGLRRISSSAARLRESLPDQSHLLDTATELYPGARVTTMVGENRAGIYVANHTNRGLIRRRVHREQPAPLQVQAYHSSVGFMVDRIRHSRVDSYRRAALLGAYLLREAAARKVLCAGHEIVQLEVVPKDEGVWVLPVAA